VKTENSPDYLSSLSQDALSWAFTTASTPLLIDVEVAKLLNVSIATVRRWRLLNQGPRWSRVGKSSVRYRLEDVTAFLDSCPYGAGREVAR